MGLKAPFKMAELFVVMLLFVVVLNKREKRKVYARFVQRLEQSTLDTIEKAFRSLGFEVLREKTLVDGNGLEVKPDFLVYDESDREILVVDYKHTLTPLNPSQVILKSTTLRESKEGIEQIRKYLTFLRDNLPLVSSQISHGKNVERIHGLLLFRWPMPIPASIDPEVKIIDWVSLSRILQQGNPVALAGLMNWVETRPDVGITTEQIKLIPEEIRVDEWTYKRFILALRPANNSLQPTAYRAAS
jgi:hypothetical protein